jgi:hypothetical protein
VGATARKSGERRRGDRESRRIPEKERQGEGGAWPDQNSTGRAAGGRVRGDGVCCWLDGLRAACCGKTRTKAEEEMLPPDWIGRTARPPTAAATRIPCYGLDPVARAAACASGASAMS